MIYMYIYIYMCLCIDCVVHGQGHEHHSWDEAGRRWGSGIQDFYFEEIRLCQAGIRLEYISME